jgi:hypothetical protein
MQHEDKRPHWQQAGRTYCAVIDGRVQALVYWDEPQPAHDERGEPLVADGGWFWFPTDDPTPWQLPNAPALRSDMSFEELVEATEAALDQAQHAIAEHFAGEAG